MAEGRDALTGKIRNPLLDRIWMGIGKYCDKCGTELINRCIACGAPVCCPKCCQEATDVEAAEAESEER